MDFLYSRQHRALLVIVLLGLAIVIAVAPYASGLLGATVLYVMCVPVFRRLHRVMRADVAAAITLTGVLLLIAIPVGWVIFLAADQLPAVLQEAQNSDVIQHLSVLRVGRIHIGTELAKASGTFIQWMSSQAFIVVGGATHATSTSSSPFSPCTTCWCRPQACGTSSVACSRFQQHRR